MLKIARWTMTHRRTVVIGWIVAAIGIFAVANTVGKKTASSFTLPGTGSQQAVDLLHSRFPTPVGVHKSPKLVNRKDLGNISAGVALMLPQRGRAGDFAAFCTGVGGHDKPRMRHVAPGGAETPA